ncbi:MAG: chemotaxis protein CheW [Desulfococcaceae bacterium]
MKEIMLFQAGDRQFGLDLSLVKGIYRAADLAEGPEGGSLSGEGVRSCRLPDGAEMPLYDFPMIFGMLSHDPRELRLYRKVIRMEVQGTALSILTDHIDRVVETDAEQIVPLPTVFGEKSRKWFPGILRTDTRLIPLLDPAGMAGIVPRSDKPGQEEIFSRLIREDAVEKQIITATDREIRRALRGEMAGMAETFMNTVRH